MKAPLTLLALLFTLSCGASGAKDPQAPDAEDGTEETQEGDGEGDGDGDSADSAYAKKLKYAKAKRGECSTLADAIQAAEKPSQEIVNLNDTPTLKRLAAAIDKELKGVINSKVTIPELSDLRDQYVSVAKDMSASLRKAAKLQDRAQKKDAFADYNEHDAESDAAIEEINLFCSVSEVE